MVNIALTLIKNFNDFEKGLTSWFERPVIEHTLINFKTHFEREYLALRRVRGNTMRNNSYYQQANSMSTMMQTMKEERDLILHEVKDSEYKILRNRKRVQPPSINETTTIHRLVRIKPSIELLMTQCNLRF